MSLQYQIEQKTKYGKSFYATNESVGKTITDMDNFPYQRFYRGQYQSNEPIIFDRKAGYRHVSNACYKTIPSYSVEYPNYRRNAYMGLSISLRIYIYFFILSN